MNTRLLWDVWKFEDIHREDFAPSYVHTVKAEVKHVNFVGEGLMIVNNSDENIDVYVEDAP